ncbi:hypothetical protein AVEN_187962-1 [Araneus ventricosus]|uniref:Uncharacterized protein n=1 Tax=Araneus ventricosus TaxID=182803 RepID=A0A4Y2E0W1_ARAVE|nr:hypothetical protein AVEN_187962-1 [Araneus ventricosus]
MSHTCSLDSSPEVRVCWQSIPGIITPIEGISSTMFARSVLELKNNSLDEITTTHGVIQWYSLGGNGYLLSMKVRRESDYKQTWTRWKTSHKTTVAVSNACSLLQANRRRSELRRGAVCEAFFSCSDEFFYSMTENYNSVNVCWKVWIHLNLYSRLAQEPWNKSPDNGRPTLPEIAADECRNWNNKPPDLDGWSQVS